MDSKASSEWLTCEPVRELLPLLNGVIQQALGVGDAEMLHVANHLLAQGGKHVRPTLLLLAANFGVGIEEELLRAAAALELLHIASLYHDDVMDRAITRRGTISANKLWGNSVATAGGVFLFARATSLLGWLGDEVNRIASVAAARVCTGQLREVETLQCRPHRG